MRNFERTTHLFDSTEETVRSMSYVSDVFVRFALVSGRLLVGSRTGIRFDERRIERGVRASLIVDRLVLVVVVFVLGRIFLLENHSNRVLVLDSGSTDIEDVWIVPHSTCLCSDAGRGDGTVQIPRPCLLRRYLGSGVVEGRRRRRPGTRRGGFQPGSRVAARDRYR